MSNDKITAQKRYSWFPVSSLYKILLRKNKLLYNLILYGNTAKVNL